MKSKSVFYGILLAGILAGVVGSTAISVCTWKEVKGFHEETNARIEKELEEKLAEKEVKEDDVTIAEQYVIRSTSAISDAYKTGDSSALDDKQKETLALASEVLGEVIRDGMSEFDKEKAVYDWMCKTLSQDKGLLTVIPSTGADSDNPYGVLKFHNAVCVGYATTFRLLMQMLDIDCKVIHNTEKYHSWNLVRIEGDWYHVDVYGDVSNGNYAHFNVTDTMRASEQSWDRAFFPSASSMKANLTYREKKIAKDFYEIPKCLKEAFEEKRSSVMILVEKEPTEEQAQSVQNLLSSIDERLISNTPKGFPSYLSTWSWFKDEVSGNYIFTVYMGEYNEENKEKSNPEETEKLFQTANEIFQGVTGFEGLVYIAP